MKLNYNGYVAAQKATRLVEMVSDYATHMELYNESLQNTTPGAVPIFPQSSIDLWRNDGGKNPLMYPNTDWRELFRNNAISQNHNLSISGGDKVKYFTSFGYLDNPGILENTGFRRYSGRVNIEAKVKPYLTLGVLASGTNSNTDIGTNALDGSAFRWIVTTSPAMIYQHPDGRYGLSNSPDVSGSGNNNALATVNSRKGGISQNRLATRFFGIFNPLKGLTLESSYTHEQTGSLTEQTPVFIDKWNFLSNTIIVSGVGRTNVSNSQARTLRKYMDGIVRYQNTLGSGLNLHAMAGASQEYYKSSSFSASKMT